MANDGMTKAEAIKKGLGSLDVVEQKRQELKQLFPEVFAEDKIDFQRLKEALGDQIDDAKERFGLSWPGKSACMNVIQSPSIATLKPEPKESVNFDTTENMIIEGDNLEVLKLLQKSYFGQIKMIYIDPPYNTGKDFVYTDRFGQTLEDYLDYTEQRDEHGKIYSVNTETSGRKHSNWLNMMYPRLYLARNLLRDDGVIFISIDDNEVHNLRALCNTVFGEENFVGEFTLQSNPRGSQSSRLLANVHEYVLGFGKNISDFRVGGLEINEDTVAEYGLSDTKGKYRLLGLRQRGGAWRREQRPLMFYPIYVNPKDGSVSLDKTEHHSTEVLPKRPTGEDGRWTWGKDKFLKNTNLLVGKSINRDGQSGAFDIFRKNYLTDDNGEEKTTKTKTIWIEKEINYQNGRNEVKELFGNSEVFDFPKPTYIVNKLAKTANLDDDDIILDFFAGSGTTGQAVMELNKEDSGNRKFILVQLPEQTDEGSEAFKAGYKTIAEITKERVRRAGKKLLEESAGKLDLDNSKIDTGFKVFKLDRSNFKIWESDADKFEAKQLEFHIDHINGKSSELDILYEILLKAGLPLDVEIKSTKLAGKMVYDIMDGGMHVCLERQITKELVDALAALNPMPLNVIMLDEGFKGNDQLKTNTVQTFKALSRNKEDAIMFRTV